MPTENEEVRDHSGPDTQVLQTTYNELLQLISQGKQVAIENFVQAGLLLAKDAVDHGNLAIATNLLSQVHRYSHEYSFISGELWAILNLAIIHFSEGVLPLARDYANLLFNAFMSLPQHVFEPQQLPDKIMIYDTITNIANAHYYERDDFNSTANLARQAIALSPEQWLGYYLLGISQLRLEQYEAAISTWEKAIALDAAHASSYLNLALAHANLGHLEEAIDSLDEAIHFSPNNPLYYMSRGQIYQQLNRHEDAIADFTSIMRFYEQSLQGEEPILPAPRSQIEYERLMPLRDRADFARMLRVRSYMTLGQIEDAIADLDFLIQEGDEATKYAGYGLKGDLYKDLDRYTDAIESYSSAIQLQPDDTSILLKRASAYTHQNLLDKAIMDLSIVTQQEKDPQAAMEQLTKILRDQPDHPQALKWRGRAYQEAWLPEQAENDFTSALALLPNDPEIYLWRGLTRITNSPLPEEEHWNNSLTLKRVHEAIDDFGFAIHLASDNSEALTAFKWLIDRVFANNFMFIWLLNGGDRKEGIFSIIPSMKGTLERFSYAIRLEGKRQWKDAINEYRAVQRELLDTGFPVWATYIHLHMADNYLRLYELQLALDHLAEAEKLYAVQSQPLTSSLMSITEEVKQKTIVRSGQIPAFIEVDYLGVYGIGHENIDLYMRLLKAQAYMRIGDSVQALSSLGDIEDFVVTEVEAPQKVSFQAEISIATILREAGKPTDALHWLKRIGDRVEDQEKRITLLNTLGTVYELIGDRKAALQSFQNACSIAIKEQNQHLLNIKINLAGSYFRNGQFREALNILREIDPEIREKALSENDLYNYYLLLAQILWRLEINDAAQQAVLEALSIADRVRGTLKFFNDRISWQARQEERYRMAVKIAFANSDRPMAFELVERSKARIFIDQLATGRLSLPPSTRQLQETESYLLRKKKLLLLLTNSIKVFGKSFIDYQVVDELRQVDEEADVLEQSNDGTQLLSVLKVEDHLAKTDERLMYIHQRIEDARFANSIVTSSQALPFPEVRQLLRSFR